MKKFHSVIFSIVAFFVVAENCLAGKSSLQVENEKFSVVISLDASTRAKKVSCAITRKSSGKIKKITVHRSFSEVSDALIAGHHLFLIGPDSLSKESPRFYSLCAFIDLDTGILVRGDDEEFTALIHPIVSPDGKKVIYDKFRPLHFRNETTDTSDIRILETTDDGITVSSVYPKTAQLYPAHQNQEETGDASGAERVFLESSFLWTKDSRKSVFLVSKPGDTSDVLHVIAITVNGSSKYTNQTKEFSKLMLKTYAKQNETMNVEELADSFEVASGTLKWQNEQTIEFKITPNGYFADKPVRINVP